MSARDSGPHGATRLSTYEHVHTRRMETFRAGTFVGDDSLEWVAEPGFFHLRGFISCLGCIVIEVDKTLSVLSGDDDPLVQTELYAYHVWIRGGGDILRYDNAHPHAGHADEHHVHYFNWRTNAQTSLRWVGVDRWPTLGQVIEEVEHWYWDNRGTLDNPDDHAPLAGLRGIPE